MNTRPKISVEKRSETQSDKRREKRTEALLRDSESMHPEHFGTVQDAGGKTATEQRPAQAVETAQAEPSTVQTLPPPPSFPREPSMFASQLRRYWRQILYSLIGIVTALLMIYWGFWRTVLLLLCGGIGLGLAECQEGRCPLKKYRRWIRERWPFVK